MPSSSKVKTTTSKASFDAKVFDWSKKLYSVVSKISSYGEVHEEIFQEFKKISNEGQALGVTTAMVDHVTPIYNHIALQGYKAHIHYLPLKKPFARASLSLINRRVVFIFPLSSAIASTKGQ